MRVAKRAARSCEFIAPWIFLGIGTQNRITNMSDADDLDRRAQTVREIRDMLEAASVNVARAHLQRFPDRRGLSGLQRTALEYATDFRDPLPKHIAAFSQCAILCPLSVLAEWKAALELEPEIAAALAKTRAAANGRAVEVALALQERARQTERVRRAMCDGLLCNLVLGCTIADGHVAHIRIPCRLEQVASESCRFRMRPLQKHTDLGREPAELLAWSIGLMSVSRNVFKRAEGLWLHTLPLLLGRDLPDVSYGLDFDEPSHRWVFSFGGVDSGIGADSAFGTDRRGYLERLHCECIEIASAAWRHVKFASNPYKRPAQTQAATALFPSVADVETMATPELRFSVGRSIGYTHDAQHLVYQFELTGASTTPATPATPTAPNPAAGLFFDRLSTGMTATSPFALEGESTYLVDAETMCRLVADLARFMARDAAALVCGYCGVAAVAGELVPPVSVAVRPLRITDLRPLVREYPWRLS